MRELSTSRKNTWKKRTILRVVTAFFGLGIIVSPVSVQADILDDAPPALEIGLAAGAEVRNSAVLTLASSDGDIASLSIELLTTHGAPLDPAMLVYDESGVKSVSLPWATNTVQDGSYKVRYTGTDQGGHAVTETRDIVVNNAQPLVTLGDASDGRMIGGSVSRRDVALEVTVNGSILESVPTIAELPDERGNYIWTIVLPEEFVYGQEIHVVVTAVVHETGRESQAVVKQILLAEPVLTVAPPKVPADPVDVVVVPPPLQLAEEIGVFVAPPLPDVEQIYAPGVMGAPAGMMGAVDVTDVPPPLPETKAAVLGAQQETTRGADGAIASPSESGWILLGTAWYWWGVLVALVGGMAVYIARRYALRTTMVS